MPRNYKPVKNPKPLGRKKGGKNTPKETAKVLAERAARKIQTDGKEQPLDLMVENMRYFKEQSQAIDGAAEDIDLDSMAPSRKRKDAEVLKRMLKKQALSLRMLAHSCAVDAAPYTHAKIQAISLSNKDGRPFVFKLHQDDMAL